MLNAGGEPSSRYRPDIEFIAHIPEAFPRSKDPDPSKVGAYAKRAEELGFDTVLVGYGSTLAESWLVAANAIYHTTSLRALVAQRPGIIPPTLLARTASTLDVLSQGRIALNLVAGGSAVEQAREGDYVEHDSRYERAKECMDIAIRCWIESGAFNYQGEFFKVEEVVQSVKPTQRPYPPLYVGGASEAGRDFAVRYADVYMLWGEPLALTSARLEEMRAAVASQNRPPIRYSVSLRLIIADTEQEAWQKAESLAPKQAPSRIAAPASEKEDFGRSRQLSLIESGLLHDDRLWLGITAASGGLGATSGLVGTREQVIDAIMEYVKLGVNCFQLSSGRGGLLDETPAFLPLLRERACQVMAQSKSKS